MENSDQNQTVNAFIENKVPEKVTASADQPAGKHPMPNTHPWVGFAAVTLVLLSLELLLRISL